MQSQRDGKRGVVVPVQNTAEASVVEGIDVIPVGSLAEAVGFYTGQLQIEPTPFSWHDAVRVLGGMRIDFSDVNSQESTTSSSANLKRLAGQGPPEIIVTPVRAFWRVWESATACVVRQCRRPRRFGDAWDRPRGREGRTPFAFGDIHLNRGGFLSRGLESTEAEIPAPKRVSRRR